MKHAALLTLHQATNKDAKGQGFKPGERNDFYQELLPDQSCQLGFIGTLNWTKRHYGLDKSERLGDLRKNVINDY